MGTTIQNILKKFDIKLNLSKEILNLNFEENYTSYIKEKDTFLFSVPTDFGYEEKELDYYVFYSEDSELLICEDNPSETVMYSKDIPKAGFALYYSYDANGVLAAFY